MTNSSSDIIIVIVSAAGALLLLLVFIISFLFIYKNRQVRNSVELKGVMERYNQEILKTQLEIREQTMKNISEEIHDNMGQVLSLVVLNLSAVEFTDPDSANTRIMKTTELVKKVITDLRNLSKTLDSENMINFGLPEMISNDLNLLEVTGRFHTRFSCTGPEQRLDPSRETVVYRIVQESLNNVIKHAEATRLEIDIRYTEERLAIEIADNGIGFQPDHTAPATIVRNGSGLKNMHSRARLIGASFEIDSGHSNGTTVRLTIPIAKTGF
ncbi:sensor histidine kinase [Puia sp.]|jgi:signal transduction histidine kinase|uniref:sensor histidine kinase n=1 Tax=Puia sp. TaxID=2045100 RepID=UPI002F3F4F3C